MSDPIEEIDHAARADGPGLPRDHGKLWITLVFWGSNYLAFTLGNYLEGSKILLSLATARAAAYVIGLGLCYLIHLELKRNRHRPFRSRAIRLAVVAPIAAEIFAWVNYFAMGFAHGVQRKLEVADWGEAIVGVSLWTWFFLAWAGIYLALEYSADAKRELERATRLAVLAKDAQIRALHNQINPHFLFNSLNALSALILEKDVETADRVVERLSSFLRRALTMDPQEDVALSLEADMALAYLSIEQVRFPDLAVDTDISPQAAKALVPALILQPLVENAIKHGVSRCLPPTRIVLAARVEAGRLEIALTNYGTPAQTVDGKAGTGIGLANVRSRLESRFGNRQSLATHRLDTKAFKVVISLPFCAA